MITPEDVARLATLSRIELSETEKAGFASEIESILSYVGQVSEVASSIEQALPLVRNVLREDENPHEPGIFTEKLLENAPAREGEYVKVKKILSYD